MATPPIRPPDIPLMTGDNDKDIKALFEYLNRLINYLFSLAV